MPEGKTPDRVTREIGDRIRFRAMPWFFTEKTIYEGTILEVCDPDGDTYYHVDAMFGKQHVEDGMVFEREVVKEESELIG